MTRTKLVSLIVLLFAAGGLAVSEAHASSSTLYFIHQDQLGSTSLVTDASGAATSRSAYYPYGTTRFSEGDSPTQRQYTGQISDTEDTGLYYYNARYYNSTIGKFTQADSAGDYLNRYIYVGNNPINKVDPTGHDDWWFESDSDDDPSIDASSAYFPSIDASSVVGSQTLTLWTGLPGESYPYPQNTSGNPEDYIRFLVGMLVASAAVPIMLGGGAIAGAVYEVVDTLSCLYTTGGDPMCAAGLAPGPNPVTVADNLKTNNYNSSRIAGALSSEGILDITPQEGEELLTIYKGLPDGSFQTICPTCYTRAHLNPTDVIIDRLETKSIESFFKEYYYSSHSPFSSWTTNIDTARRYAQDGEIVQMNIPRTLVIDVNALNPNHTFWSDYEILVPGIIPIPK